MLPGSFSGIARTLQSLNGWWRYGDSHFPRSFSIEISKFCNRTCSYCPNSIHETPKENISNENYEKFISRLAEIKWNGVVDFIFYNEPLLHPDIVGLVRRLKQVVPWCLPRIITNGDVLCSPLARDLINEGVFNFWVTRHVPVKPHWDARMADLQVEFPGYVTVTDIMDVQAKQGLHTRAGMVKVENEYKVDSCHSSQSCQHFDINLKALLCCNDYHKVHGFGNLNEKSIMEIWNDKSYRRIRNELREGITKLPICKNCIVRQK